MRRFSAPGLWIEPAVYTGSAVLMWFIPVFDRLHAESSAVIATVAFFTAGSVTSRLIRDELRAGRLPAPTGGRRTGETPPRRRLAGSLPVFQIVAARLGWLVLPAALLTLSSLWAPNCDWLRGAGLYLLFAPPTVVFSVGLAVFLTVRTRRPRRWLILTGVGILVVGPVFDIGFHPQFYTYNMVFGGVLGPLYDEDLIVRFGLYVHRVLTLSWGLFFLSARSRFTWSSLALVFSIGIAYVFSGPLGLNTPLGYLQNSFDGFLRTQHFDIYFDPSAHDSVDVERLIEEHEFRYAMLSEQLGIEVDGRIQSFVYPDMERRAALTGARVTSVAPVWLRRPQLHVTRRGFRRTFPHELAHVFSREFGLPVVHASLHVGLVEGFAVAVEPIHAGPPPHEQVAAVEWARIVEGGASGAARLDEVTFRSADRVASSLSAAGFWGSRSAVSYTTMGSFVQYLLSAAGPEAFMAAYPTGDFDDAYGRSLPELTASWEDYLKRLSVMSRSAGPGAMRRFSVPSLFERRCPHWVSPAARKLRQVSALVRDGRRNKALIMLRTLPADDLSAPSVRLLHADLLVDDEPGEALKLVAGDESAESFPPVDRSPYASALAGDAYALRGEGRKARTAYSRSITHEDPTAESRRVLRILSRSLAGYPAAIRVIRSLGRETEVPDPDDVIRAENASDAFSAQERHSWSIVAGWLAYRKNHYSEAVEHLESVSAPRNKSPEASGSGMAGAMLWPTGEVERFRIRLSSLAHLRLGNVEEALRLARRGVKEYLNAGDRWNARVAEDLVQRIEWITNEYPAWQ